MRTKEITNNLKQILEESKNNHIYNYNKCDSCKSYILNNCVKCENPLFDCVNKDFIEHSDQISMNQNNRYYSYRVIDIILNTYETVSSILSYDRMSSMISYVYAVLLLLSIMFILCPKYIYIGFTIITGVNIVMYIVFYIISKLKIKKFKKYQNSIT